MRLFSARGQEAQRVYAAADTFDARSARRRHFVVTRNVNYTNVCYFRCGFCAFSKGKLAEDLRGKPYLVPVEEIARRAEEAWARGGVEICLQGGIHPAFTGDTYAEICEAVKAAVLNYTCTRSPRSRCGRGRRRSGSTSRSISRACARPGSRRCPGRPRSSTTRCGRSSARTRSRQGQWLSVRPAHRVGLRSTTTIMFGHVEGPRSWAPT